MRQGKKPGERKQKKKLKELKRELGSRYLYQRVGGGRESPGRKGQDPELLYGRPAAVLAAGCVKLEAVWYQRDGKPRLCYEVSVKDDPEAEAWICYDSPEDAVRLKEAEMFAVLDRIVTERGLSYTDCPFRRIPGCRVEPAGKPERMEKEHG